MSFFLCRYMLDKYVYSIYLVSLVAADDIISTLCVINNINHSRPIIRRNDIRFTNKPFYSIAKVDTRKVKLVLFRAFMWTINPEYRLILNTLANIANIVNIVPMTTIHCCVIHAMLCYAMLFMYYTRDIFM